MTEYIRGFLALIILMTVLLHLPSGKNYQKYIRFFAELIMTLALLSPILRIFYDSEEFLEMVAYEAFVEELEMVSMDMEQVEYLHSDYHRESYEEAIAMDVRRIVEEYPLEVEAVKVNLSEDYYVERICLQLTDAGQEMIEVGRITLQEANEERETAAVVQLRQELMDLYELEDSQIEIQYVAG